MTRTIVALVAVSFITLDARAEESELARRLTPALRSIARAAEREEHDRLLVVVREIRGTTAPPALLPQIRTAVKDLLTEMGLSVVESPDALDVLGTESERRLVEVDQVANLQQGIEFDALVTVDFQRRGKRTSIRIALIDEERPRTVRTVRLRNVPMLPKFLPQLTPLTPNGTAGGLSNPTGSIPPLSQGLSGFRKGGATNQSTRPGPQRQTAQGSQTDDDEDSDDDSDDDSNDDADDDSDDDDQEECQQEVPATNRAIVRFAVGELGNQVGNGECWTLAAEALEAAGAEPPRLYDFGQEIKQENIVPGDILQFTSARFNLPDGGFIFMGTPNHTAIVYALNGDQVFVLHQNFGQRIVTMLDFRFADMTSGSVQAYRAIPAEESP